MQGFAYVPLRIHKKLVLGTLPYINVITTISRFVSISGLTTSEPEANSKPVTTESTNEPIDNTV